MFWFSLEQPQPVIKSFINHFSSLSSLVLFVIFLFFLAALSHQLCSASAAATLWGDRWCCRHSAAGCWYCIWRIRRSVGAAAAAVRPHPHLRPLQKSGDWEAILVFFSSYVSAFRIEVVFSPLFLAPRVQENVDAVKWRRFFVTTSVSRLRDESFWSEESALNKDFVLFLFKRRDIYIFLKRKVSQM